ncbi:MAG: tRNA epoxyqueuosine(34) reductase QueG [Hyphomicrobiales bacterium]|nr:tRNA epoxyqueuosine(34) reductase QueG [Hyphomicrobiales bacterium]
MRARAAALGFDALGTCDPDATLSAGARLDAWLAEGMHGEMAWMEDPRRGAPRLIWPDVRGVVVVAMNYGPGPPPADAAADGSRATISVYARGRDYHEVVKGKLKELADFLRSRAVGGDAKVFVDTAALMEKPLAQAAGLGWQGKHTNLVSRELGSWFFLGVILTDVELPRAAPHDDRCGTCRACLDACPTNAFPAPYRLDARRCVSYLTIELAGPIPRQFREAIGDRIYGCDDCLLACPWNRFAVAASEAKFAARAATTAPDLAGLAALDDATFRARFAGTAVKRIGRDRFARNVAIAIGNSGRADLIGATSRLLDDPSPLVRGAAVWAAARLMSAPAFAALAGARTGRERDADVRDEWAAEGFA